MSPRHSKFSSPPLVVADELTRCELEVARRADDLARRPGANLLTDLELWLQSEREVFAARRRRERDAQTAVRSVRRMPG